MRKDLRGLIVPSTFFTPLASMSVRHPTYVVAYCNVSAQLQFSMTGCRRDELLGLEWSRVDLKANVLRLGSVHTKGSRERLVPTNADAHEQPQHGDRSYGGTHVRQILRRGARQPGCAHGCAHGDRGGAEGIQAARHEQNIRLLYQAYLEAKRREEGKPKDRARGHEVDRACEVLYGPSLTRPLNGKQIPPWLRGSPSNFQQRRRRAGYGQRVLNASQKPVQISRQRPKAIAPQSHLPKVVDIIWVRGYLIAGRFKWRENLLDGIIRILN